MLTYEEELALSDLIVEKYGVQQQLEEGQQPTAEQDAIIQRGIGAASKLVEAYLPAIRSYASSMLAKSYSPRVTFDDLVNVGVVEAMLRSATFNCRGNGSRPGKRFASYAGQAISKAMGRHLAKMSVALTVNVDVIITSYEWGKFKAELKDKLGYEPSIEQVEDASGINYDYVAGAPSQASFTEIDDENAPEVEGLAPRMEAMPSEYIQQEAAIRRALQSVFGEEVVDDMILMFGLDRMYIRDRDEMAIHRGWGAAKTTRRIKFLKSAIAHPAFRVNMARTLNSEQTP